MRRLLTILVLTGVAFVGLAACGDDDDTTAGDDDATTTTAAKGGSATTKEGAFTGKDSEDFCNLLRNFRDRFSTPPDFSNKEAVKTEFEALAKVFSDLADNAPAEIKADVDVSATAFAKYYEALKAADFDPNKVDLSQTGLDSEEVNAASQRLEKYGKDVCGISDPTTTSP